MRFNEREKKTRYKRGRVLTGHGQRPFVLFFFLIEKRKEKRKECYDGLRCGRRDSSWNPDHGNVFFRMSGCVVAYNNGKGC